MLVRSSRRRVAAAVAAALLAGALTTWLTRGGPADDPGDLRAAAGATTAGARAIPSADAAPPAASPTTSPTSDPASPTPVTATPDPITPDPTRTTTKLRAPAAPTVLAVPRLGATMEVDPVGVDRRGDMVIPDDPRVAGWYRYGADPGSATGATVLAAHVDDRERGTGPLARLGTLRRGDPVTVSAGGVDHVYRVATVLRLDKGELDTEDLFDREGPSRLHLVTCGGDFDRATGHYEDNIVVVATPVG